MSRRRGKRKKVEGVEPEVQEEDQAHSVTPEDGTNHDQSSDRAGELSDLTTDNKATDIPEVTSDVSSDIGCVEQPDLLGIKEPPVNTKPENKSETELDDQVASEQASAVYKPQDDTPAQAAEPKPESEQRDGDDDPYSKGRPEQKFRLKSQDNVAKRLQLRFLCFLIGGCALIAIFPHQWLPPVGTMVFYLVSGLIVARRPIEKDVFADSIYYMGFVFTFVALLFLVGPFAPGGETLGSRDVIAKLGIALGTTVFGMIARLLITHFNQITQSPNEDLTKSVSALTAELHDQLSGILGDVQKHRRTSFRQISEHEKKVGDAIHSMSETFQNELRTEIAELKSFRERTTEEIQLYNKAVADKLATDLTSVTSTIDSHFKQSLEKVDTANDSLVEKVSGLSLPADHLLKKLDGALEPLIEKIASLADEIKTLKTVTNQITTQATKISKQTSTISTSIQEFAGHSQHFIEMGEAATAAKASLNEVSTVVNELGSAVEQLKRESKSTVDGKVEGLTSSIADVEANIQSVNSTLESVRTSANELGVKAESLLSETIDLIDRELPKNE